MTRLIWGKESVYIYRANIHACANTHAFKHVCVVNVWDDTRVGVCVCGSSHFAKSSN